MGSLALRYATRIGIEPGASAYATGTAPSYPSSTGTTTRYTPSTRLAQKPLALATFAIRPETTPLGYSYFFATAPSGDTPSGGEEYTA